MSGRLQPQVKFGWRCAWLEGGSERMEAFSPSALNGMTGPWEALRPHGFGVA